MLLGPERIPMARQELERLVREEAPEADPAAILGDGTVWEQIHRWNAWAGPRRHSRFILVDHGDEVEILIGHPMRPRHSPAV